MNNLHEDPSDIPEVEERAQPEPMDDIQRETYRNETPRNHDLLDEKGYFVATRLSEFEMVQRLARMARHQLLWKTDGTPRYEVHFVDEERELQAEEAASFLDQKREEYRNTNDLFSNQ